MNDSKPNRYTDHRLELEVTPRWWPRLGGQNLAADQPQTADIIARSLLLAVGAFKTCEVRVSRRSLKLVLPMPEDVTLEALCGRAGRLIEQMNLLDPSHH